MINHNVNRTDAWNAALHEHDVLATTPTANGNADSDASTTMVSWYSAPWLIAECYMYCRIHEALGSSSLLSGHDVFRTSKEASFTASQSPIRVLAAVLVQMQCAPMSPANFKTVMQVRVSQESYVLSLLVQRKDLQPCLTGINAMCARVYIQTVYMHSSPPTAC